MKHLLISFSVFVLIVSCSTTSNENVTSEKIEIDTLLAVSELEGTWALSSYFDSIVTHKEVARYRLQSCAWFGILLNIRKDSIENYGSINDGIVSRKDGDTLAYFSSIGGTYALLNKSPQLHLFEVKNEYREVDTTLYVYEKRPDLDYLLDSLEDKRMKLDKNITRYFNQKLMTGKYLFNRSLDTVVFKENGIVSGFRNYTNYSVRNYFGTSHPFNEMDVLVCSNNSITDYWSWKFEQDVLILTKLKGDFYKTDKYWPLEETLILNSLQDE